VAAELIPNWQTTLDALQKLDSVGDSRPVGYYGLSAAGESGIRLVAAEPRITAAVVEKTLHANPGGHFGMPPFEIDSSIRFFARHLGSAGVPSSS
jgi:hypothetical protein